MMRDAIEKAAPCARCDGKGWTGPVHVNMGDRHEWRKRMDCYTCGGSGKISAEQAAAIATGEKHRLARIDRAETLAACSKRLGISPSQLCDYEHGRIFVNGYKTAMSALRREIEGGGVGR